MAKSYTSFCISTPIILAFVFKVKNKGIGAFPQHKSTIFFVFEVVLIKSANNILSTEKLNMSSS